MKTKFKRIICVFLCCTLIFSTFSFTASAQEYSDIENKFLNQSNQSSTYALTPAVALAGPEIALLLAAGYGLYYTASHADDIYQSLNSFLQASASTVENGSTLLAQWWNQCKNTGTIALNTASGFIANAIAQWALSLHKGNDITVSTIKGTFQDFYLGDSVLIDYEGNSVQYYSYDKDVTTPAPVGYTARWCRLLKNDVSQRYEFYSLVYYFKPLNTTFYINSKYEQTGSTGNSYTNKITGQVYKGDYGNRTFYNYIPYNDENFSEKLAIAQSIADNSLKYDDYGSTSACKDFFLKLLTGDATLPTSSVCPDVKVGGIGNVLNGDNIDSLVMPNINVGNISADLTVGQLYDKVISGEISWAEYWDIVGVGTIDVPYVQVGDSAYPITDTGVSSRPITETNTSTNNPSFLPDGAMLDDYAVDLTDFFPFCIPFDIYDFFSVLCAEPEAPYWEFEFPNPVGENFTFVIDLKPFDNVAMILRDLQILLFIVALGFKTRDLIRG